ncbi:hypothetical protein K469DRAFT_720688, partial [Zopfia rhizophila CBS 207.26]
MVKATALELRAFPSIGINDDITLYPENTPLHLYISTRELEDDRRGKLRRLEKQARDKSIPITIKKRTKDGQTLSTDIATWVEMDPTEIANELYEQILYIKALEQQTDTLFHIANDALHAESEIAEALRPSKVETQAEKAADETPSQPAKQRQTRQNARFPSLCGGSSSALHRTLGSVYATHLSVSQGKRSAKFPDPPILDDGVNPTFKNWNKQMRNKLRLNAD